MNTVMTLLKDKNDHLLKFLQLNETELANFLKEISTTLKFLFIQRNDTGFDPL